MAKRFCRKADPCSRGTNRLFKAIASVRKDEVRDLASKTGPELEYEVSLL